MVGNQTIWRHPCSDPRGVKGRQSIENKGIGFMHDFAATYMGDAPIVGNSQSTFGPDQRVKKQVGKKESSLFFVIAGQKPRPDSA